MSDLFDQSAGLPALNSWVWTLGECVSYLTYYGAKVDILTGSPRVSFPSATPDEVKRRALPQLKRLRGQLIDHYFGAGSPYAPKPARIRDEMPRESHNYAATGESASQARNRLLSEARARASATGQPLWLLLRNGLCVKPEHEPRVLHVRVGRGKTRTVRITVEREALYVCVGSDSAAWVRLPKVTSRFEDEALETARERAARRKRKSKGQ